MLKTLTTASPLLAIVLLAMIPTDVVAGKSFAVVNGYSQHFDSSYDWNENNYGFGLEHEFEQKSAWKKVVMANGFRDSTDNMSYMAGAGLHRRVFETEYLGGAVGLRRPERLPDDPRRYRRLTVPWHPAKPKHRQRHRRSQPDLPAPRGGRKGHELDRRRPDPERHPVHAVQDQPGSDSAVVPRPIRSSRAVRRSRSQAPTRRSSECRRQARSWPTSRARASCRNPSACAACRPASRHRTSAPRRSRRFARSDAPGRRY